MDNFLDESTNSTATVPTSSDVTTVASSTTPSTVSFIETLPEELRKDPNITKFKDTAGLAKSYVEQSKFLGDSIRIPKEGSKPEDMQAFLEKVQAVPGVTYLDTTNEDSIKGVLKKLGYPDSPDKYDLKDIPVEVGDEVLATYKEKAHKLGLTNEQARQVALALKEDRDQFQSMRVKQATEFKEKAVSELKKEWGSEYDNKISQAKEAFKLYKEKFPTEAKLLQESSGNNPLIARLLVDMHSALKESTHIQGLGVGNGMTVADAVKRKNEILNSDRRTHPYYDLRHPDHDSYVQEIDKLYKIISPNSSL